MHALGCFLEDLLTLDGFIVNGNGFVFSKSQEIWLGFFLDCIFHISITYFYAKVVNSRENSKNYLENIIFDEYSENLRAIIVILAYMPT
jgi:hypothetical protein